MTIFCTFVSLFFAYFIAKHYKISGSNVYLSLFMEQGRVSGSNSGEKLPYRLYVPGTVAKGEKIPLIVVLHGAYSRGDENIRQMDHRVRKFVSREFQEIQPAYVVAPQCPVKLEWNDLQPSPPPYLNYVMDNGPPSWRLRLISKLVHQLSELYSVDASRVYITGESMGATGTWEMLFRFPEIFAAAVILNGRADPDIADTIAQTPVRSFHGRGDIIAPVENSREMARALTGAGGDIKFTELDGGHSISRIADTREMYRWMIEKRLSGNREREKTKPE